MRNRSRGIRRLLPLVHRLKLKDGIPGDPPSMSLWMPRPAASGGRYHESVTVTALSAEQEALFRLIEDTRDHVFVTGRAGTGKSTLLQHLAWNTSKQIAVCAPTGVAALNVEGQTIHSLFRLPIGLIAKGEIDQTDAHPQDPQRDRHPRDRRTRWSTPT